MKGHLLKVLLATILWSIVSPLTAVAQIAVSLPNLSIGPNSSLTIPVNVGSLTGQGVIAYEFVISCDSTILRLDGIDASGTLSSGWSVIANNSAGGFNPGRMKVVAATFAPASGSGVLINLRATTKNKGDSTALQLSGFIFNAGSPASSVTNGSVRVNAPGHPPVIAPVSAKTVAEADPLSFTVSATDPDGYAMTFTSDNLPPGATLNGSTGVFSWTPGYMQAGSYSVKLKVRDTAGGTDSTYVSITVTNVNRRPVFTAVPAQSIRDKDTLRLPLSAIDPDGDGLTYSFVSIAPIPTNSPNVNGNVLTWRAVFADTGRTYALKVRVTDNIATGGGVVPGVDSLTVSVTVEPRPRGDVDGDGVLRAADVSSALKYIAGLITLTDPGDLWAFDANHDGLINAYDASLILQAAAGLITLTN